MSQLIKNKSQVTKNKTFFMKLYDKKVSNKSNNTDKKNRQFIVVSEQVKTT